MIKYTLQENCVIRENEDGTFTAIPLVEGNSDYAAYLEDEATAK
jgi:hypothetical protein